MKKCIGKGHDCIDDSWTSPLPSFTPLHILIKRICWSRPSKRTYALWHQINLSSRLLPQFAKVQQFFFTQRNIANLKVRTGFDICKRSVLTSVKKSSMSRTFATILCSILLDVSASMWRNCKWKCATTALFHREISALLRSKEHETFGQRTYHLATSSCASEKGKETPLVPSERCGPAHSVMKTSQ